MVPDFASVFIDLLALGLAIAAHIRINNLTRRLELRDRLFRDDGK